MGDEARGCTSAQARAIERKETTWHRRHVPDLDDFSRGEIELVLDTADAIREVLDREIKRTSESRSRW